MRRSRIRKLKRQCIEMCVFENRMSTIQLQDLTMAVSNPEMCPQRDTYSLAVGTRMNSLVIRLSARGPPLSPALQSGFTLRTWRLPFTNNFMPAEPKIRELVLSWCLRVFLVGGPCIIGCKRKLARSFVRSPGDTREPSWQLALSSQTWCQPN